MRKFARSQADSTRGWKCPRCGNKRQVKDGRIVELGFRRHNGKRWCARCGAGRR